MVDPFEFAGGLVGKLFPIHGTFIWRTRSMAMNERAITKLIGLSVSGVFFAMLVLNAIAG